jgi:hypothetical protein
VVSVVKAPPVENKPVRNTADTSFVYSAAGRRPAHGSRVLPLPEIAFFLQMCCPSFMKTGVFSLPGKILPMQNQCLSLLADADKEGLQKEDYHFTLLQELKKQMAIEVTSYSHLAGTV